MEIAEPRIKSLVFLRWWLRPPSCLVSCCLFFSPLTSQGDTLGSATRSKKEVGEVQHQLQQSPGVCCDTKSELPLAFSQSLAVTLGNRKLRKSAPEVLVKPTGTSDPDYRNFRSGY